LGRVGQFLPVDPFNSPGHTIGGILATALSGPLRLRYGSPRDFVIGLRVALPDGRLVSSGGRVVKNVSGYDMNKLHQGALGSLGVIVAASFKVFPRPLHEVTVETRSDDPWREAARALALPQAPVALELASDGRLLGRLAGTAAGGRVAGAAGGARGAQARGRRVGHAAGHDRVDDAASRRVRPEADALARALRGLSGRRPGRRPCRHIGPGRLASTVLDIRDPST